MPKKKCQYCKKKLGIVIYGCKCKYKNLCVRCKLPNSHKCNFNFLKESQKKLKKDNPTIKFDKLEKIN